MGKQIDERVVEMRFENGQFESNVKQSMSTIEKLKSALKFNDQSKGLENVATAAKKVDMNQLASSVDKVKVSFSALQVVAATALSRITNSAITAGKNIVSALTIDPVMTGFQEYETKMNAVQTIMANVSSKGKTISDVTAVLDELNYYADKTIYNFTEMTRNIGTFTAAGVDLEVAASAIQGISNLAATSGSTSMQASTAMYQLSQAIAAGTVKLQDWNSVVNAGMGGEIFQEGLKETAREMGIAVDSIVEKSGSFRESLSEGWITADVLNTTLKKFTVEGAEEYCKSMEASGKYTKEMSAKVMEQARTMEDAATKIKTFSQLWDTLKESAQSGWTESWEIIIGDFEEAKETLSGIGDLLTGFVQNAADRRNDILRNVFGGNESAWDDFGAKIEKAGISLDDFQNKMIEVGKEHGVITDQMIQDAGGFTESLKSGWASADIIKETIQSYIEGGSQVTKSTEDMTAKLEEFQKVVNEVWMGKWSTGEDRYKKLADAGYDYVKVQELVNKTVDGHKLTLEDLSISQAKEIGFTEEQIAILQELSAQADATGSDLNTLIQEMSKPMSGRELLWGGVTNIINAVAKALGALRSAWAEVFDIDTAGILYKLLEGFYAFSEAILMSDESAENLKNTFKGLFSILKLVANLVTGAIKGAFTVLKSIFSSANIDILKYTGYIGNLISRFTEFVTSAKGVTTVTNALRNAFTFVIEKAQQFWQWLTNLQVVQNLFAKATEFVNNKVETLKMLFGDTWKLFESFYDRIKAMDFSDGFHLSDLVNILKDFKTNVINEVADINGIISGIKVNIKQAPSNLSTAASGIGTGLSKIYDVLHSFADKLQLNIRPNINVGEILAVGLGASTIYYITQFGKLLETLKAPLESVENLLNSVAKVPTAISGYINAMTKNVKADYVYTLAKSLAMLAASLVALAAIPADRLKQAVIAMGLLAGVLAALSFALSKMGIGTGAAGTAGAAGLAAMAAALISLGAGLALVAKALKTISSVSGTDGFGSALVSLELIMVTFAGLAKLMTVGGIATTWAGAIKSIGTMLAFALAIKMVASALNSIGDMDSDKILASMMGLSGVMIAMRVVMGSMKGISISSGAGAIAALVALKMMMSTMADLAAMPLDTIVGAFPALLAIAAQLAILMAATNLAGKNSLRGGIGVAAMASSLILITQAMKTLAEISEGDLERASNTMYKLMALMSLMMASTALSGKRSIQGGIAIVAMAGSITLLAGAIAVLSELDPAGVETATKAIAAIGVMFTALLAASSKATGAKATIIALVTSITILVAALAALAMIDGEAVTRSAIIVESLIGIFTVMMGVLGKLKVSPTGFAGMIACVAAIGTMVTMITRIDAQTALPAAQSILELCLGLSAMMLALGKIKFSSAAVLGKNLLAMIGAGGVLAGISALVAWLSSMNIQGLSNQTMKSIAFLTAMVAALSGLSAAMGALTKLVGFSNVMLGEVAIAGIVGIFTALTAAIGAIADAFDSIGVDLLAKIEKGADVLGKVGTAIGKFFGGIAGGAREEYSSHLPEVGTAMSEFAENIQPFLNINDKIQNADLSNMTQIVEQIGDMYKMEFFRGLGQKFNLGDMSMADIGKDLAKFGEGVADMVDATADLDPGAMTRMSSITSSIASLMGNLSLEGGAVEFFAGSKNIEEFATHLAPFAEGIAQAVEAFRKTTVTETDIANISQVVNVSNKLAELQSSIEPMGGLVEAFLGTSNLSVFGTQISSFATSLGSAIEAFRRTPVTEADTANIQTVCDICNKLSSLTPNIEPMGGLVDALMGANDLATFGATLTPFVIGLGSALHSLKLAALDDTDTTNVDKLVAITQKFTALTDDIEPIGGFISFFTGQKDLGSFGTNLKDFATNLMEALKVFGAIDDGSADFKATTVDTSLVENIVTVTEQFKTLATDIPDAKTALEKLFSGDNSLKGFANQIKDFSEEIMPAFEALGILGGGDTAAVPKTIDVSFIDKIVEAVTKLTGIQKAIEPIDTWLKEMSSGTTTDPSVFAEKMKSFAQDFMPALQAFGAIQYTGMGGAGQIIDSGMLDNVINAVKKLAELQTALNAENQKTIDEGYSPLNLETFATRISDLGTAMGTFNSAIGSNFNAAGIEQAIGAMSKIGELQTTLNQNKTADSGGETVDLSKFASKIEALGKAMGKFSTALGEGFDSTAIDQAIASMKKITELQTALGAASEGGASGTSLGQFATNLGQLGTQMKTMTTNFSGIDWTSVDTAITNINKLSDLASQLASADFSGFTAFSNQLGELATNSIQKFVQGFQNGGSQASAAVANFVNQIRTSLSNNVSNVTEAGGNLVKDIPQKIRSYGSEMSSAGSELAKAVKTGIDNGQQGIASAFNSALQACVNAVRNARSSFQSAGQYAAEGMAAGIKSGTASAVAAAKAMASAVTAAARVELDINSPSKVFDKIGEYIVAGLSNGIRDNTPKAEKQSIKTAQGIVEAFQKKLEIHSPSKVTRDEVGAYIVDGIAEGIEKTDSAEDAAEKKAQNIVNAFKEEIDKFELDETSWDLEEKLWEAMNPEAKDEEKTAKTIELNQKKLQTQASKVLLAQGEYETTVKTLGAQTEKAQEAYNKYLQETTELYELANTIVEAQKSSQTKTVETQKEAYLKATEFMNDESIKTMLSLGYTMEQLWDYAFEKFGYDKNMGFIEQTADGTLSEAQQMVNAALANAKGTYAEFTGTATAAGTAAGNAYTTATANAISSSTSTTTAAATKNVTSTTAAVATASATQASTTGAAYGDALASGITSKTSVVQEAMKKVLQLSSDDLKTIAQQTIDEFVKAIGSIANKTDELTDYEPVIRPVVDMSDVEKKAQIINSTFNGGGSSSSYRVASKVQNGLNSSSTRTATSTKATTSGNVYNVTQNNYSPKALDRSTIYRQTKNLYSQVAKQSPQIVSSTYAKSNG